MSITNRIEVTDEMVSRFLAWRLPETFQPDGGISYKPVERHPEWTHDTRPTGTNLFTATEAKAMLEHVLRTAEVADALGRVNSASVIDSTTAKGG